MEKALIDTIGFAEITDLSKRQIARLRDMGALPPCVRIGRSVKWRVADIEAWIANDCRPVRPAPTTKRRA